MSRIVQINLPGYPPGLSSFVQPNPMEESMEDYLMGFSAAAADVRAYKARAPKRAEALVECDREAALRMVAEGKHVAYWTGYASGLASAFGA